jgi:hypothetical protein
MVDIVEEINSKNFYLLLSAAEAVRKTPEEEICIHGNLCIDDEMTNFKWPENLKICGWLQVDTKLPFEFPDNITVLENVWLYNTSIKILPNNFIIEGYLNIAKSSIEKLPDNLKVIGPIYVEEEKVSYMREINNYKKGFNILPSSLI